MLHIRKIKPMFTSIVTTGDKLEKDLIEKNIIIARKGDMKVWQTVIAVGPAVRDLKVGDQVMINVDNYALKRYSKDSLQNDMDNNPSLGYKFNWVTIDDEKGNPQECLLLNDRDILYSFEGEEIDEPLIGIGGKEIIL